MIEPELGNSECKFSLDLTLGDFGFGFRLVNTNKQGGQKMIDSGNYSNPEGAPISCSCHAAINQSTSCSWHAAYWSLVGAGPEGFGLGLDINVTGRGISRAAGQAVLGSKFSCMSLSRNWCLYNKFFKS